MYKNIIYFLLFVTLLSCSKKEPLAVEDFNTSDASVQFIDTFQVNLSTVLVDSLPTSVSERMICGFLDLNGTGKITASPFFQVTVNATNASGGLVMKLQARTEPIYDSLVLIMNHNYTYGDTASTHSVKVYRITQDLNLNGLTGKLYNSSNFIYDPNPLATKAFNFTKSNELRITLSNSLGNELFNLAKNGDYKLSNNATFKDYFKGLALMPDGNTKSIYGYNLSTVMRLYYHENESGSIVLYHDFVITSYENHFNRIVNDRSTTKLKSLTIPYTSIIQQQTDGEAYLLTGIELMPKIEFPTVTNFKYTYPYAAVNKAELIIHPKAGTYNQFYYPPDRLLLYNTNSANVPGNAIAIQSSSYAQMATPKVDWEASDLTYYTFDITDFISTKLDNENTESALLLASSKEESARRVERLIISSGFQKSDVKLKLYITTFK